MKPARPPRPGPLTAALGARLLADVIQLADDGHPTPCVTDPDPFTSDDQHERAAAAAACLRCPLLQTCATYAHIAHEPAHVWAGVDLTPRVGGRPGGIDPRHSLAAAAGYPTTTHEVHP